MNYEDMSLEELKALAKERGIKIGNIGKEALIEKLNTDNVDEDKPTDTLAAITAAIDEIDGSAEEEMIERLPRETVVGVRSITFGCVIYKSRSGGAIYSWDQIGSVQHMTIAELEEMNSNSPDFLRKPLLILLDQRAVKHFRLGAVYESVAQITNLDKLLKQDIGTIENAVEAALAANMRDILISKVRTMYEKEKLTNIKVIRLLEKKLQFDLST